MKRILFFCSILLLGFSNLLRANSELIIIGSCHVPTKEYNSSVLTDILLKLEPDLVLIEYDSTYFDENWNLIKHYGGLDETVILQVQQKLNIPVRPFDIEGRSKFYKEHKFQETEKELWDKRNAVMAQNIKKYVQQFPNKRIVVVAGADHRPYLRKLLISEQNGYILQEYWELMKN